MTSKTTNKLSPEVRVRAVRMLLEHEGEHPLRWAEIMSISAKIGCVAQMLNEWVEKVELDSGRKPGLTTDIAAKLKTLERENWELREANEILRKASAYFAQALSENAYIRPSGKKTARAHALWRSTGGRMQVRPGRDHNAHLRMFCLA